MEGTIQLNMCSNVDRIALMAKQLKSGDGETGDTAFGDIIRGFMASEGKATGDMGGLLDGMTQESIEELPGRTVLKGNTEGESVEDSPAELDAVMHAGGTLPGKFEAVLSECAKAANENASDTPAYSEKTAQAEVLEGSLETHGTTSVEAVITEVGKSMQKQSVQVDTAVYAKAKVNPAEPATKETAAQSGMKCVGKPGMASGETNHVARGVVKQALVESEPAGMKVLTAAEDGMLASVKEQILTRRLVQLQSNPVGGREALTSEKREVGTTGGQGVNDTIPGEVGIAETVDAEIIKVKAAGIERPEATAIKAEIPGATASGIEMAETTVVEADMPKVIAAETIDERAVKSLNDVYGMGTFAETPFEVKSKSAPEAADTGFAKPLAAIENMDEIAGKVEIEMGRIRENGKSSVKVRLRPEELGNIEIRLSQENGVVKGKIFVESHEVKEQLSRFLSENKSMQMPDGVKSKEIEVGIFNQQSGGFREFGQQTFNSRRHFRNEEFWKQPGEKGGEMLRSVDQSMKGLDLFA